MKKIMILISLMMLASSAMAQTPADSINHVVDSLFIRASNGNVMYTDLVAPSKKALADMGESAVPRLVEKMKTQDAREMQTLEDVFKMIGHQAVTHLIYAMGSDNVYRRRLSTRLLGEIADTAAVMGLLGYVNDPDFRMRAGVITALGKIGDGRATPYSRGALKDSDYLVRTAAAIALSNLKDPGTVSSLIDALSDQYYGVRFSAAQALSNIGEPAVMPVKLAIEQRHDSLAFYLLLEVAGNLADNDLTSLLGRHLDSEDAYARAFAAEALGKIGTEDALKLLHKRYDVETHPLVVPKIESVVLRTY